MDDIQIPEEAKKDFTELVKSLSSDINILRKLRRKKFTTFEDFMSFSRQYLSDNAASFLFFLLGQEDNKQLFKALLDAGMEEGDVKLISKFYHDIKEILTKRGVTIPQNNDQPTEEIFENQIYGMRSFLLYIPRSSQPFLDVTFFRRDNTELLRFKEPIQDISRDASTLWRLVAHEYQEIAGEKASHQLPLVEDVKAQEAENLEMTIMALLQICQALNLDFDAAVEKSKHQLKENINADRDPSKEPE